MSEAAPPAHPWAAAYPPDIAWDAPIASRPLHSILDDAVARWGDRPCADFLDRVYSYRQIGRLADRAAKGLQALGVGPDVRVGLFLPNTPYYVIFFYAVLKCGGTVVNFNPTYVEREVAAQVADADVSIMVTLDLAALHAKLAPLLGQGKFDRLVVCPMAGILPFPKNLLYPFAKRKETARLPRDRHHVRYRDLIRNDGRFRPVAVGDDDLALLQYTGGTTGLPKAAMLTHRNLFANTVQSSLWFNRAKQGEDAILAVLPFFHVFAMTVALNLAIFYGLRIIMLPRFDLDQVMRTIQAKKPALFPAVPTIYAAISTHKQRASYDLASIRMCISGGAPLPVEVHRNFTGITGCALVEGYGLTEASPVVACNPLFGDNRIGTIGLPLPQTVIDIVSLDDRVTVLPPGERGELCIRGPQVMAGYWRRPEETAEVLRQGRLHTGDVAVMGPDGYVTIVDRIKDLVIVAGFNVYPRVVEDAIYQHPEVAECVVIGIDDDLRGQLVKAFVKRREGAALSDSALRAFLKDRISPTEMPRRIEFRDELPKTAVGKLSRKALQEEEAAKREARKARLAARGAAPGG